jgi:hypothetical protein
MINDDGDVKFIDLEFAYELDGSDAHLFVQTPGFASPDQLRNELPSPSDDYYALGVLILDIVSFFAAGMDLNREGILNSFELHLRELRLPVDLRTVVEGLTALDASQRWDLDQAEAALLAIPLPPNKGLLFQQLGRVPERPKPEPCLLPNLRETVEGIATFLEQKARFGRDDTLWPASPSVFQSSPIGLQFGSAGPSLFLQRYRGKVPDQVVAWLVQRARATDSPPGLFSGLSGLALVLLEDGRVDEATVFLELANSSELVSADSGLYYGLAGLATANLQFWNRLRDEKYLDFSIAAGKLLTEKARVAENGAAWSEPGESPLGLALGPAGISLFLTYLSAATGDQSHLELAHAALKFEISHVQEIGELLLWFPAANSSPAEPKSPHTFFGTAGTGMALLRTGLLTGDEYLLKWAERCGGTVAERYTNKLWYDYGLAGYGEYLLDLYWFSGKKRYWTAATYLAEAVMLHRVKKPEGYVFLGENHHRFCCDFSMGSSGIGLFLDRVVNPEKARVLLPDQLLKDALSPASALSANSTKAAFVSFAET